MEIPVIDTIKALLNQKLVDLESVLDANVLVFCGSIYDGLELQFLHIVEQLANDENKRDSLYVVLTTLGGSATTVERIVNIVRKHYSTVNFIVPDKAYSAGTIFCMSGNEILMDYFSVLGPIDPQVRSKDGSYVPALGYLDKVEGLLQRAKCSDFTQAEFVILKEMDLAELRKYEQARDLTIDLLQKWLVKYKFSGWEKHKDGSEVTLEQKENRAKEIATALSDNKKWKSHGRPINIEILRDELKLKIRDYSDEPDLKNAIRSYYDLMNDFLQRNRIDIFVHTRNFI